MKESRQSFRGIRVQDDNIMESTNARSPLTFRNLLYVVVTCKTIRHEEARETF